MRTAICTDDALQFSADHLCDDRAKCVNDDIWLELSFELINLKQVWQNKDDTH